MRVVVGSIHHWIDDIDENHSSTEWRPKKNHRWPAVHRARLRELLLIAKLYESPDGGGDDDDDDDDDDDSVTEYIPVHRAACLHLLPEELLQLLFTFVAPPLIEPCSKSCVWECPRRAPEIPQTVIDIRRMADELFACSFDNIGPDLTFREVIDCTELTFWASVTTQTDVSALDIFLLLWCTSMQYMEPMDCPIKRAYYFGLTRFKKKTNLATNIEHCTAFWLPPYVPPEVYFTAYSETHTRWAEDEPFTSRKVKSERTAERKRKKAEKLKWKQESKRRRRKK